DFPVGLESGTVDVKLVGEVRDDSPATAEGGIEHAGGRVAGEDNPNPSRALAAARHDELAIRLLEDAFPGCLCRIAEARAHLPAPANPRIEQAIGVVAD